MENDPIELSVPGAGTGLGLNWSPDSRRLSWPGYNVPLRILAVDREASRAKPDFPSPFDSGVWGVVWSRGGDRVSTWCRHSTLWSPSGRILKQFAPGDRVFLHPDGRRAAIGTEYSPFQLVELTRGAATEPATLFPGNEGVIRCGGWSPDGKLLAIGTDDAKVRVWSDDGKPVMTLEGHAVPIKSLAWSRDGEYLASAEDGEVRLWNRQGQAVATVASAKSDGHIRAVEWHPKAALLAAVHNEKVRLLGADGEVKWVREINAGVRECQFNCDGNLLAAVSGDCVEVLGLDGKPVYHHRLGDYNGGENGPAWRPDGLQIAIPGWESAIYDAAGGKMRRRLPFEDQWNIRFAWSPDAETLAAGAFGGVLRVWDLNTEQFRWTALHLPSGPISFTLAGQILDGDAEKVKDELAYVVQRTPDGPQELWTYQQFAQFVAKAGMELRMPAPESESPIRSPKSEMSSH
jgi:WD40 repeat protein